MKPVEIKKRFSIGDGSLAVIAGPCMAESLDVCLRTAEFLVKLCAELGVNYVFKASYDKANRTSAGSRRGPGIQEGLGFLRAVAERFDVPVITDVHESGDVPAVAQAVDMLQIPAFLCRQTDLLVAASRTGLPVNIKKGQFMAPEDMKGAVEKVRSTGNEKVMLCERGTSFGYHNLVVDMRGLVAMRNLGVPVVFDATHSVQIPSGNGGSSGGRRDLVYPLAGAAAAVGIDALFCEVHPDPDNAFSDGPNSLDFELARRVITRTKAIHDLD